MKNIILYVVFFYWLLVWPLSGQASELLQSVSLLPDSFVDCASTKVPPQKLNWLQIKAGDSYCIAIDINLPVTHPKIRSDDTPSLLVSALGASRLYLNGQLIAGNGIPALNVANEVPGQIEFLYPLSFITLQPGMHQLRMQLSTHHAPHGLFQYLYLIDVVGTQSFLYERQQKHVYILLLCGALMMAAILVAVLGLTLGKRQHWLVFSMLTLVTACLLLTESWRSLFGYLYPLHYLRLHLIWFFALLFSVLLPMYFLLLYRIALSKFVWPIFILLFSFSYFLPFSQDGKVLLLMAMGLLSGLFITIMAVYRQYAGGSLGLVVVLLASGLFAHQYWYFAERGFVWVVVLLMMPLLYQLVRQWTHDQRRAELALQLENQLLHKSLQPHFLMNCLELMNELQRENPAQAEQFIQLLSEAFRLLNQYASQTLIPFEQELHLCRNYLQLTAIRLQQPHQLEITGSYSGIELPPAALLVLLENAFSHNKYDCGQIFLLELQHKKEKVIIHLKLPLGSKRSHQGSGTGTAYLQKSLQGCFNGKAKMSSKVENSYWLVSIELPA